MSGLLLLALLQQGSLDPDLAALLARVPPPRPRVPSVFNVVSAERLYAGDQLNVLTAAWLPRSLRLRLRQAPSLTPPVLTGVWATPRAPVAGAVASREGEDEVHDLFVVAQTVYPLNPGTLTIPPSRLSWLEPARRSGPERSATVASAPLTVQVRPLPTSGQPAGFAGPVGRDVRIEYRLAGSGRAGIALPVEVAILGMGSLPLWAPPTIVWPSGARAYDQGSDVSFGPLGSRMGGTRIFRYGIVPDSAGGLSLPPLEYPYFDPASASYRVARTPGTIVPILEPPPVAAPRAVVPLLEPGPPPLAHRVGTLPGYVLGALIGLPLAVLAGISLWRRYPRQARRPEPGSPPERLEQLVRELLPPGTGPSRHAIAAALRHAGVSPEPAERLARLHLGIEALRYGGARGTMEAESQAMGTEIERELGRVPARIRRAAGLAAALLLGLPGILMSQGGFELYTRGQYHAAAAAFREEARRLPGAERWYNVAAAEYLGGRDAHAVAALLPVRAAEPRDPRIRSLWNALAREHAELRRIGREWPLTAEECFSLALLASWLSLGAFLVARKGPALWTVPAGVALILVLAGMIRRAERQHQRAVLSGGVSQRISPHSLAPVTGVLPAFTIVELTRREGNWGLVESEDREGWVPAQILVPVEKF